MPVSSLSLSYESSSEDEDCAPPQKRRKLPALSSTLTVQKPVDDPALHQGRTRSSPFVEGQWAAYVYVPVRLDSESSFDRVLAAAVRAAQLQVPTLHPLGIRQGRKNAVELHISLSRPIYLRAHQRADLEHAVQALAEKACPFQASFATIAALKNDEMTRVFLAFEVGAGHDEFGALSGALSPMLEFLRQQTYYAYPRFHASFAWALLGPDNPTPAGASKEASPPAPFGTIPDLPSGLLTSLIEGFEARLSSPTAAAFEVDRIAVQIGKVIHEYTLQGNSTSRLS